MMSADGGNQQYPIENRYERRRREIYERLVSTARAIMFNRSLREVTVQEITDAADVGKGTFFNYFPTKEHLISCVQEYNRRALISAVKRARAEEATPMAALTDAFRWLIGPLEGDWLTYQDSVMRAMVLTSDVRSRMSHELKENLTCYEELAALGQEQGSIRNDLPHTDLARAIQMCAAGFSVLLWIDGKTPTHAVLDDMMRILASLVAPLNPPAAFGAPSKRVAKAATRPARRAAHRSRGVTTPTKAAGSPGRRPRK